MDTNDDAMSYALPLLLGTTMTQSQVAMCAQNSLDGFIDLDWNYINNWNTINLIPAVVRDQDIVSPWREDEAMIVNQQEPTTIFMVTVISTSTSVSNELSVLEYRRKCREAKGALDIYVQCRRRTNHLPQLRDSSIYERSEDTLFPTWI